MSLLRPSTKAADATAAEIGDRVLRVLLALGVAASALFGAFVGLDDALHASAPHFAPWTIAGFQGLDPSTAAGAAKIAERAGLDLLSGLAAAGAGGFLGVLLGLIPLLPAALVLSILAQGVVAGARRLSAAKS